MRLHRPYGYDNACGIIALAIITGWKQETIRKKVLAARRRFPLDEKGQRCKKSVMERSTDYVYQNEFLRVLQGKGINTRFYELPRKREVCQLPKKLRKGTYLLMIPMHALVVQNGRIWDNTGTDQSLEYYYWRHDQILLYAKLPNFQNSSN